MIPVLTTADFGDLPLDFFLAPGLCFDCVGQLHKEFVFTLDIFGSYFPRRCTVHLLKELPHIEMIVAGKGKRLLMDSIRYKTVLAADVAPFYGIDFKCQSGAAAGIVVYFRLDGIGIDIYNLQLRYGDYSPALHSLHKDFRTSPESLKSGFGRACRDSEIVKISFVYNLGFEAFHVVDISVVRIEIFKCYTCHNSCSHPVFIAQCASIFNSIAYVHKLCL